MTVIRYDPEGEDGRYGFMDDKADGDYVHYEDYEALSKQLTEATLQLNMALRENAGLRERVAAAERELDNSPVVVWQD